MKLRLIREMSNLKIMKRKRNNKKKCEIGNIKEFMKIVCWNKGNSKLEEKIIKKI